MGKTMQKNITATPIKQKVNNENEKQTKHWRQLDNEEIMKAASPPRALGRQ